MLVAMCFFKISLQLLMVCYCGDDRSEGPLKLVKPLVHMYCKEVCLLNSAPVLDISSEITE